MTVAPAPVPPTPNPDDGTTPTPEPTPSPTPGDGSTPGSTPDGTTPGSTPNPAPAAAGPLDALAGVLEGAYESVTGGPEADNPVEEERIYDAENPLGRESVEDHCWVHWYMIVGMVLTAVYGLAAALRRKNHERRLRNDMNDVLGDGDGKDPSGSPVKPAGTEPGAMRCATIWCWARRPFVTALLLVLWYHLGFNRIDSPLDLTLAIVWWAGIVAIAAILVRFEERRRRQIRTLYVSPKSLYSSELGMVGIGEAGAVEAMRGMLGQLKYGFDSKGLPDRKKFEYRFVVRTDEFKEHDSEDGKPADGAAASSAAQRKDPTWKGTVIKIDRKNGNSETPFDGIDQLKAALA